MDRPQKRSKSPRFRCWGLIVAAGSAQRYGQEPPKQYQLIGDVPLLQFSLNCFNAVPDIAGMVVGVSAIDQWFDSLCQAPAKFLGVFVGGASRSETVLRGLEALTSHAEADDWVLVHDAARPCLRVSDLQYLIENNIETSILFSHPPTNINISPRNYDSPKSIIKYKHPQRPEERSESPKGRT